MPVSSGPNISGDASTNKGSDSKHPVNHFSAKKSVKSKAGLDKVNPSSVILSGEMMLKHIGWEKAADLIKHAMNETFKQKKVTYDFARQMKDATLLKCSEFGDAIISNM